MAKSKSKSAVSVKGYKRKVGNKTITVKGYKRKK